MNFDKFCAIYVDSKCSRVQLRNNPDGVVCNIQGCKEGSERKATRDSTGSCQESESESADSGNSRSDHRRRSPQCAGLPGNRSGPSPARQRRKLRHPSE